MDQCPFLFIGTPGLDLYSTFTLKQHGSDQALPNAVGDENSLLVQGTHAIKSAFEDDMENVK
jgi:hypothetical protein